MDDPYLRSDLQVLADASLISVPVNSYPLRWSRIDTDLQLIDMVQLPPSVNQAYAHVNYALNRAMDGNGKRGAKLAYANRSRDDQSFAAPITIRSQIQSSYELVENDYAFRLAANYQRALDQSGNEENDFGLDDSYFATNWGNFAATIGSTQHWWGPTWIYNVAWGHTRKAVPGINLAYDAYDWPLLGSWHAESFGAKDETLNRNNKQWSNRFEFSPLNQLNIGVVYQKWFNKEGWDSYLSGSLQSPAGIQDQFSADIRLSLPVWNMGTTVLTQSVYVQGASLVNDRSLGSLVMGWQSQFNLNEQYLRWIVEVKKLTDDAEQQRQSMLSDRTTLAGLHYQSAINGLDLGESKAVKLLWVTSNNWEVSLQGQRYENMNQNMQNQFTFSVRLPLANSRVTFGSDYTPDITAGETDKWNYWGIWDFRF
ncbi:capsule assembly Wzi family protein [Vibrio sp. PP-XX7]